MYTAVIAGIVVCEECVPLAEQFLDNPGTADHVNRVIGLLRHAYPESEEPGRVALVARLYRAHSIDDYQLWLLLSNHDTAVMPVPSAAQAYEDLGFVPFAGYPLKLA